VTSKVKLACEPQIQMIPVCWLVPLKVLPPNCRKGSKYLQIAASIRELGLIEPLVVHPKAGTDGQYLLLDGHIRLLVLMDMGVQEVKCLIAKDDESYTYNHKVNRLTPVQEHFMILKAIKSGVPEHRIAMTLNVDVASIIRKRDLLNGICPEAIALLKDKATAAGAFREMRKVKPMRQIEMAELMASAHNFSAVYAKCLLAATPNDQLVEPHSQKEVEGLTPTDMARMEHEMESIVRDFKLIEDSYGENVLNLVVVVGYVKRLLDNVRVVRYLSHICPEILAEFQNIARAKRLADEH
jgi:hypothetical protein